MSKNGFGKLLAGVSIGAVLGVLFAPKKGSETREDLMKSFEDLAEKVKNMDKEDVKRIVDLKIAEIKDQLKDLDKETVLEEAKKQAKKLQDAASELVDYAAQKSTPVVQKSAESLKKKVISVSKSVTKKLEKGEK